MSRDMLKIFIEPVMRMTLDVNLYEDGASAFWYSVDTGSDVYEWTKDTGQNWITDPASNLFNNFLSTATSIFTSAYNFLTPNGRPE